MSKLGPALRSQFMKGVKDVLKTTAKETMKSAAEELLTKRPRISTVDRVSMSPPSSPTSFSVAAPPRPPPTEFPALCVCKYEPDAPDLGSGNRQYICSGCSRSGMGEYKTVVEGRKFVSAASPLKGGKNKNKRKTGKRRRSRLHLTKRIRVRHNGRSRC
jgi:hypothetical protein